MFQKRNVCQNNTDTLHKNKKYLEAPKLPPASEGKYWNNTYEVEEKCKLLLMLLNGATSK